MTITTANIFDFRDRPIHCAKGVCTPRLYADGWLVRFTADNPEIKSDKVESQDVHSACAFINAHEPR